MKFSKLSLISAALFCGSFAFAEEQYEEINSNLTKDFYVSSTDVLTIKVTNTHTLSGRFQGSAVGNGENFSEKYKFYDLSGNVATGNYGQGVIHISGGGTLEYQGFSDISYYNSTYLVHAGDGGADGDQVPYEADMSTSLIVPSSQDLRTPDAQKSAFAGRIVVSGGTTLLVGGYICQQVAYAFPPEVAQGRPADFAIHQAGASNVVLADTAKISFKSAPKNLLDLDFEYNDPGDFGAPAGAQPVRALNFLTNVQASIGSTIEIGTDVESSHRIIITSTGVADPDQTGFNEAPEGWNAESTIGILSGTGRVYFAGHGNVSILNKATFLTTADTPTEVAPVTGAHSDILNYVHNLGANYELDLAYRDETTGLNGREMADVYFTNTGVNGNGGTVRLGSDSTHTRVVNNVLETATAVQLSAISVDGRSENFGGVSWEVRPSYAGFENNPGGPRSVNVLEINGVQVLNNLQSLFIEREGLLREFAEAVPGDNAREAFEITNMSTLSSLAYGSRIATRTGSSLIINQFKDRDGVFCGNFVAADQETNFQALNDSYIFKTGEGTFVNVVNQTVAVNNKINRLYVLEGAWIGTVSTLGDLNSRIIVSAGAELKIVSNVTGYLFANIEGDGASSFVLTRDSSETVTAEDGTTSLRGGFSNDGREFLISESNVISRVDGAGVQLQHDLLKPGTVIVLKEQPNFYGTVTVMEGMTLGLGYDSRTLGTGNEGETSPLHGKPYELGSVFSNASGIILQSGGANENFTKLEINRYQIVSNLSGDQSTSVRLLDYSTLVLNTQKADLVYTGSITGQGGIVKLGALNQTLIGGNAGTLYNGSTVILNGSISLATENTLRQSSGVILNTNTTLSNTVIGAAQSIGGLVGERGSVVNMGSGTLTVGIAPVDAETIRNGIANHYAGKAAYPDYRIENAAYFFATYNGEEKYFSEEGLDLKNAGISDLESNNVKGKLGFTKFGSIRPVYKNKENGTLAAMTVDNLIADIKDPGQLANAFAHLYTTIDSGVYGTISADSNWQACFSGISAGSIREFIDKAFDYTVVKSFADAQRANTNSTWTERQLQELLNFAENLQYSRVAVVDGEGSLTRVAYKALVDVHAIRFLKEHYMQAALAPTYTAEELQDRLDSFYGFVTIFDKDYKFVLTNANVEAISQVYGFDVSQWNGDFKEFEKSLGVTPGAYGPEFAGEIMGAGAKLVKIGYETLTLTGNNTYTGATEIREGELRADWDAIKSTSEISVSEGALFTIVADDALNNGLIPENVFSIGEAGKGILVGAGTLLKDGKGTLVIDSALDYETQRDDNGNVTKGFTGAIIVGEGILKVNIASRETFESDIYINKDAVFELAFKEPDALTREIEPETRVLTFTGSLNGTEGIFKKTGAGTIKFANGASFAEGNSVKFDIADGDVIIALNRGNGVSSTAFRDETFKTVLHANSGFVLDVAEFADWSFSGDLEGIGGNTRFSKTGAGNLTLNRTTPWTGIDKLEIAHGKLTIANGASYAFKQLVGGSDAYSTRSPSFVLDGSLALDISAGQENVFYGDFSGDATGTLTKKGNGTLSFVGNSSFKGAINLNEGFLEFSSDSNLAPFAKSIAITDDVLGGTLVKSGRGDLDLQKTKIDAVKRDATTNQLLSGISMDIREGKVSVSVGTNFTDLNQLNIENGARFEIKKTGTTTLGKLFEKLSGAGSLALGEGTVTFDSNDKLQEFTGTIELLDSKSHLVIGQGISSFSGIAGAGTLELGEANFEFNQTNDGVFTGTLTGITTGTAFTVSGNGRMILSKGTGQNAVFDNISSLSVGKASEAGHIGIGKEQVLGISVPVDILANGSSIALVDAVNFQGTTGTAIKQAFNVVPTSGNNTIGLFAHGTIEFSDATNLAEFFNLQNAGTTKLSLSNYGVSGNDLVLKKLGAMTAANPNMSLSTSAGSALALDTEGSNFTYVQSIGGTGSFKKQGAGTLTLSAAQHSYRGTTNVLAGTLEFGSPAKLESSEIVVAAGATLKGGVELVSRNANVTFGYASSSAIYEASLEKGEHISYTGTISGNVELKLTTGTATRGTPYALFEYAGPTAQEDIPDLSNTTIRLLDESDRVFIDQAQLATGNLVVYVAQEDLSEVPGVEIHKGLGSFTEILSDWACPNSSGQIDNDTVEQNIIGEALNRTSNGELGAEISKLSPLSYAAMISMPHAGFNNDARALSSRLQNRLYDNAFVSWLYKADWEFFAQAQSTNASNSSGKDSMVYDYNTFGVLAGMDIKSSLENSFGFALAYDYGKASIHNSGGSIEGSNVRLNTFLGTLVEDYNLSLNFGAQIGFSRYDVKRNTLMGRNTGDTSGWQMGLFAEAVQVLPISENNQGDRFDIFPHIGLDISYYSVDGFKEKGSLSKLESSDFDAVSIQGRLGAAFTWTLVGESLTTRISLDVSAVQEFGDDETDIKTSLLGEKSTVSAKALPSTSFAIAPGVSFALDQETSIYFNYEFRAGTESEILHSANLGFRVRF